MIQWIKECTAVVFVLILIPIPYFLFKCILEIKPATNTFTTATTCTLNCKEKSLLKKNRINNRKRQWEKNAIELIKNNNNDKLVYCIFLFPVFHVKNIRNYFHFGSPMPIKCQSSLFLN